METRQITEVRIYKLIMNRVTDCAESATICALSTDYDRLVNWYNDQFAAEPYRDDRYLKRFKQGSPLEWFNPIDTTELNMIGIFGHGIGDEWISMDCYNGLDGRYLII